MKQTYVFCMSLVSLQPCTKELEVHNASLENQETRLAGEKRHMTKNTHWVTTPAFVYVQVLVGSRVVLFSVGLSRRPVPWPVYTMFLYKRCRMNWASLLLHWNSVCKITSFIERVWKTTKQDYLEKNETWLRTRIEWLRWIFYMFESLWYLGSCCPALACPVVLSPGQCRLGFCIRGAVWTRRLSCYTGTQCDHPCAGLKKTKQDLLEKNEAWLRIGIAWLHWIVYMFDSLWTYLLYML